jgi:predicted deacylase
VHGDEMHGTAVVEGLLKVFEKEPLHAWKITFVPQVNVQWYQDKVRTIGKEWPDLNRCYWMNLHLLADDLYNILLEQAKLVIDVHDAWSDDVLLPHVRYFPDDEDSVLMANHMWTPVIIPRPWKEWMLATHLKNNNISSLTVEVGWGPELQTHDIEHGIAWIMNILQAYDMVSPYSTWATLKQSEIYTHRYWFVPHAKWSFAMDEHIGMWDIVEAWTYLWEFKEVSWTTHKIYSPIEGKVFSYRLADVMTPDQSPAERLISFVTKQELAAVPSWPRWWPKFINMPM